MFRRLAPLAYRASLRKLARGMSLASLGMMLTCGTGTGTGNAALLDPDDFASLGSAALAGNVPLDLAGLNPTLGGFTGVYSGGVAVFSFDSFSLGAGAIITQAGAGGPPVAILSRGAISIAGSIDLSGKGGAGGQGGAPGSATSLGGIGGTGQGAGGGGGGVSLEIDFGGRAVVGKGGGGGGFGGAGTVGDGGLGSPPTGSLAGPAVAGRLIDDLASGSGGGGGGGFDPLPVPGQALEGGSGGAGGGGLALVAEAAFDLLTTASISAKGADGESGGFEGAGGGGSGGGILISGDVVALAGRLDAQGGWGGSGARGAFAGGGGGGKIEVYYGSGYTQSGIVNVSGGLSGNAGLVGEGGDFSATRQSVATIREPGTLLLFGAGLLAMALIARRFSRG